MLGIFKFNATPAMVIKISVITSFTYTKKMVSAEKMTEEHDYLFSLTVYKAC